MKTSISKTDLKQLQKFAENTAVGAGKILLEHYQTAKIVSRKSDFGDIATEADLASEKFIIAEINHKYPKHQILSEEAGLNSNLSDFVWIVDPLDGTREYNRKIPFFNVSIALECDGELVACAIYRPMSNDLYSASFGNGAYLNGNLMKASGETDLSRCYISSQFPNYKNSKKELKKTFFILSTLVEKIYRLRPFQETAANLCFVGSGSHDGYLCAFNGPKWWDVAPGLLIVSEAGGKVTDMRGKPIVNRNLSHGIVVSNGKIHDELLKIIYHD